MFPNTHDVIPLSERPSLVEYQKRAEDLVTACHASAPDAMRAWATQWPDHVDQIARLAHDTLTLGNCAIAAAQLVIARIHGFENWPTFAAHLDALARPASPVSNFEAAADAIAIGDATALQRLLRDDPDLVHATSTRQHHATLLHYTGANGVENYRQKTPHNIVAIATMLLDAGADVNAEADIYGGSDTLGLAATSIFPERAGVQDALMQLLLNRGATLERPGIAGRKHSIVRACLANGRGPAAEFLAARGAPLDLEGAAGIGRLDIVRRFVDEDGTLRTGATAQELNAGFAWACEYGRTDVAAFLLDRGAPVDATLLPNGQTGLHWASIGGHGAIVRLLLDRHAPVNAVDKDYQSTPLQWALHGWTDPPSGSAREDYYDVVARLVRAGSAVNPVWLDEHAEQTPFGRTLRAVPRMLAALSSKACTARFSTTPARHRRGRR
jgi:hypothetical protein